jgi:DNA replication protein DnaC
MDTWFNDSCPICKGAGFIHQVIDGKPNYRDVIPCKCRVAKLEEERRQFLLASCKFPPKADGMTFDKYKVNARNQTAFEAARGMAVNPGRTQWLAFLGDNGVGKTHLAVAICKAWVNAGIPARYVFTSLLLDELRSGYSADNPENNYDARFNYYKNVPLLLLDDYGAESKTDWVQEKMDALIDYRLMNNLSLLVTSNKTLEQMPNRIRSRLFRQKDSVVMVGGKEWVAQ